MKCKGLDGIFLGIFEKTPLKSLLDIQLKAIIILTGKIKFGLLGAN